MTVDGDRPRGASIEDPVRAVAPER